MGEAKLLEDPEQYKKSFKRFKGDQLNGWLQDKAPYCGQQGTVTRTFGDKTVTMVFDDGTQFDFPMESIGQQISTYGNFKIGGARLKKADEAVFKPYFKRFVGDDLNYWNDKKQLKNGELGFITTVYGDKTVTMYFNDGETWDFPFEAIEA